MVGVFCDLPCVSRGSQIGKEGLVVFEDDIGISGTEGCICGKGEMHVAIAVFLGGLCNDIGRLWEEGGVEF